MLPALSLNNVLTLVGRVRELFSTKTWALIFFHCSGLIKSIVRQPMCYARYAQVQTCCLEKQLEEMKRQRRASEKKGRKNQDFPSKERESGKLQLIMNPQGSLAHAQNVHVIRCCVN